MTRGWRGFGACFVIFREATVSLSVGASEQIDALEHIRLEKREEWRSNARDDLRIYVLADADGNRQSELRTMTRSTAELENKLRTERIQRAEAIVEAARHRLATRQRAVDEELQRENDRRALLGLSPEPAKPIAAAISGIELAEINYLQTEKRYLWRLCLDGETL
jgi:hypothetical protein